MLLQEIKCISFMMRSEPKVLSNDSYWIGQAWLCIIYCHICRNRNNDNDNKRYHYRFLTSLKSSSLSLALSTLKNNGVQNLCHKQINNLRVYMPLESDLNDMIDILKCILVAYVGYFNCYDANNCGHPWKCLYLNVHVVWYLTCLLKLLLAVYMGNWYIM